LALLSFELLDAEGVAPCSIIGGGDPGGFLCNFEVLPLDLEWVFLEMFVLGEDTDVKIDAIGPELSGTLNSIAATIHSHGG